jgi:hypothetical protein
MAESAGRCIEPQGMVLLHLEGGENEVQPSLSRIPDHLWVPSFGPLSDRGGTRPYARTSLGPEPEKTLP